MKILLNNEKKEIQKNTSITELVKSTEFDGKPLVVKLNGKIVEYNEFDSTILQEDDRLKIFNFVGGG